MMGISLKNRVKTYSHISTTLSSLSNQHLSTLLDKAKPMHTGIGGKSVLLMLDEIPIFVKRVPLTDLERHPKHIMSTANYFDLPLFYQYGIGSTGFGVWRELFAHIMTTNWVISEECPNFPLMYHWRVLPTSKSESMNAEQSEDLKQEIAYWENSSAVRKRLEAIHNASADILLFLEYIPQTLHQYLEDKINAEDEIAESAVSFVGKQLKTTNEFMNSNGFLHLDAHFANLLTDGLLLYYTDFGLSLSSRFELSQDEMDFF